MAVPAWERSAGVTAASLWRAVPGVTVGRQPAVRRRMLRRSCQSGRGECPAGACAHSAERAVVHRFACLGALPRGTTRGALRAPLKSPQRKL